MFLRLLVYRNQMPMEDLPTQETWSRDSLNNYLTSELQDKSLRFDADYQSEVDEGGLMVKQYKAIFLESN